MCYECNSIDDPRCADFDNKENIQKFQPVNCSAQLTASNRTEWSTDYKTTNVCRKTHQTGWKMWISACSTWAKIVFLVQGNLRVSRGCGFIEAESYDDKKCMRRTGTKVRILWRALTSHNKTFQLPLGHHDSLLFLLRQLVQCFKPAFQPSTSCLCSSDCLGGFLPYATNQFLKLKMGWFVWLVAQPVARSYLNKVMHWTCEEVIRPTIKDWMLIVYFRFAPFH